jgi:hypothetical protein
MDYRQNKKIMKIRITFLTLLAVSASMVASAQVAEYDDMYFNSTDRTVVQASKPLTLKNISSESYEVKTAINPTDSYSARNVNPEYISQSTVNPSGSVEKAPYFIPDYSPVAVNQNLNKNSNYYGNNSYPGMMPAYGSPYNSFSPSMYGYSPYGYGYNNGFNSMYGYNPYGYNGFNSGWSSMLSMTFGMGSYCPWGGSSFYGNYSPYNYMGMGYGGYYPNNVIVINNEYNSNVAYGKRSSRSSDLNNTINANNRNTAMITTDSQGRVRGSGGRVSSVDATNANSSTYYQSGWRTNPETNSAVRSNWSSSGRSGSESGSTNTGFFNNNSGSTSRSSSYDNSSSRTSNFGGGNSNFSSGGGSRSSGSAVGGGGGSSSTSGARRGRD